MHNTVRTIARNFNINPVSVYKCKYYYVINSPQGSFSLSVARPRKERIEEIHSCKEELVKNGFYALDTYVLNNDNKPYCEYDGNIYTMTKYFGSNELDILSNVQIGIALETIGTMAKSIKYSSNDIVYAAEVGNPVIKSYEKQLSQLSKSRKRLSLNKEFDIKINKYIDLVMNKAANALNNLIKLDYGKKITLCHNSLKEGNIIYNKGKCWIIDWDNMKYRHYMEDCAYFIKRYIRKNAFYTKDTKADYMCLDELLKHYTKYFHPSQEDMDILWELLSYPHRFVSLINEYCSKNRGFVPSGLGAKITECMNEWDFLYRYIAK